ncbi:hypothetical protein N825_07195 [Skermanella stibiiresistens SB22]|uniref:Uncharacterized protein n=1 Tax=Skermanella stibiiresistens SB22 TaxID=1385369 RepID=W9H096_9PROT|nr:hypothetical protein [Skermanella stibiiresistens]EWY39504.1 hypothetical protein N825_07195 [Skermanella stibiiresistens SB22]
MKMFILGSLTAIVIAVAAGIVMPNFLGEPAYDAFSTKNARVSEENTATHRFGAEGR